MSISNEYDEIKFGKRSQNFFELSPFYFCTFEAYGKKWRTLVHFWVASYFKSNPDMMETIRNLDTPEKALRVGARYGLKSLGQVNPKDVLYAIQERFNQNDSIRNILLCTGLVYLRYDGVGYMAENNRYGKILMKVREIYAVE
jgi:predicted NAD-dependent protein-ADP-ribosyltransferase YbiA (DUF1768 family)